MISNVKYSKLSEIKDAVLDAMGAHKPSLQIDLEDYTLKIDEIRDLLFDIYKTSNLPSMPYTLYAKFDFVFKATITFKYEVD